MNAGNRRGPAVVRGLAALLMLLVLLVGLPVALLEYGGSVIPDHWSFSVSGISKALSSPDSGRVFMQALVLVGALGWLCFAVSVLVELPAQLSHRPTVRIRGLGWSQGAAAVLVTSILVMFAAPLASAVPLSAQARPAAAVTATRAPITQAVAVSASGPHRAESTVSNAAAATSYTVQPGDSLWKIAQEQLGNGTEYPSIVALNAGRVMPDGSVFHAEGFLMPGWQLLLPSHSVHLSHDTPEGHHVVTRGESLWEIAGHEYGDPNEWPKIFAANEGADQNGGHFTDPNLIFPGETLEIPHLSAPAAEVAPPVAAPPIAVTPIAAQLGEVGAMAGVEEALADTARTEAPLATDPSQSTNTSISAVPGVGTVTPDGEQNNLLIEFGISGISAAALLALLAQRRRVQQNQRFVGQRIAMPDLQAVGHERRLRAGADPADRDFLERALRTLARYSADTGRLIPEVAAAVLREGGVELRLSHACAPIEPFAALDESVWWCPKDQAKLLSRKAADEQPVPYPAMVIVGEAGDGEPVLLDLEHYGVVEIGGDQRQAAGVVRSLGVELPWSDYVSVAPAGLSLSPELARNPVRHDPPDQVLPALENWAQAVSQALPDDAGTGTEPLRTARISQSNPGATDPRVLLGAQGFATPENAERLTAIAQREPRAGAAAVVVVDESVPAGNHRITVDAAGNALLDDLNLVVTMQRVDEEQHDRLLAVMTPTGLPSVVEPEWQFGVDEFQRTAAGQPGLGELLASAAERQSERYAKGESVSLRVLGPIDVAGSAVPVADQKLVEAAAYIVLHPGVGIASLSADLGIGVQAAGTRLAQLRDTVGLDDEGQELLPVAADGRIAFSGQVGCDWFVFEEHRRNGRFAEALALVRGEPFAEARPGRYGWVEPYRQVMVSTIIDVAHTLAQAYLHEREFESARLAVGRGLGAVPYAELLYRDLMVVVAEEAGPGRDEELATLFATFNEACDEYGVEPMPETVKVMHQLDGLARKSVPAGLRSVS